MDTPTLTGFVAWVRTAMGVSTGDLPDGSVYFTYAYNMAIALVNQALTTAGPPIYMLAVYNLGGSNLLNFAQDTPPSTFFADTRKALGLLNFVPGLPSTVSDEGSAVGLTAQEFMSNLTLGDLQLLKDPYGRQYLVFAQKYGTLWGLN